MSAARQQAFDMVKDGKSLEEIGAAVNRAASTVHQYLAEFINQTHLSDPFPWVEPGTFAKIRNARRQLPNDLFRPIFDALGGTVPYHEIRIALACMQFEPPSEPPGEI